MMNTLIDEVNISKNQRPLWLGMSLLLISGIGLAVVGFDDIRALFNKPSSPVELAEQVIVNGNEQQRIEALTLIKKDRLKVDVEILKRVFSSDDSLLVRQLALKTVLYRMERREAKKFLEQVVATESDPKILQIINYRLQKLSEEISWLYKE